MPETEPQPSPTQESTPVSEPALKLQETPPIPADAPPSPESPPLSAPTTTETESQPRASTQTPPTEVSSPAAMAPAPAAPEPPRPSPQSFLAKALETIQFRKRAKLEKIIKLAAEKRSITNDQVQKLLRVSDATATRYLSELVREGRLRRTGTTTSIVYEPV